MEEKNNINNVDLKVLQDINTSIKNLQKFLENESKENQIKENKIKIFNENKEQQVKEQQKKLLLKQEIKEKEFKDFFNKIDTISLDIKTVDKKFDDVSTFMQVNIVANGLLIGIVCILLFSKFLGGK